MPVVPNSAYVSIQTVTLLMRSIANDVIYSQAGEILTDDANFMLPLLNDTLEWLTRELNNNGVDTFTKETTLTPLTPVEGANVSDPAVQVNVGDNGYFDGTGITMGPQLQIPPDLLEPLVLWERGTGTLEGWREVNKVLDGLPSRVPSSRFSMWEYRSDQIWMLGATQSNDVRLRYKGSSAAFVSADDTLYLRGGAGAVAWYTVGTYLASRNPEAAKDCRGEAKERVYQMINQSVLADQEVTTTRKSYGSQQRRGSWRPPTNQ